MERKESTSENVETLHAETTSDWMSKLSSILGEPTYKIDKEYDPDARDEIAMYHVRREGISETVELNDSNTIGLSVMRDYKGARRFRVDFRDTDEDGKGHSFYSPYVAQITINKNDGEISFYEAILEGVNTRPIICLFTSGKTVPSIANRENGD